MAEVTELLRPDDSTWDQWLDRAPHDFYHRAAYHAFAERMGEGCAQLLVYGTPQRFLAWPYLLTSIDGSEQTDVTSVYGYSGPIALGLKNADFRARAWSAMRAVWNEQRQVALFTRFHPVLGNHAYCEDWHGASNPHGNELLCLGRSVSIDLSLSRDERRAAYPKILRQEIRAAERAGLVVEHDRQWIHFETFAELYRATMAKNSADQRYLFSQQYLAGLRAALGNDGHLVVAHKDGEVAAALFFTVHGHIAQAHLTGINPLFHSISPLKCLLDGSAEIARGLGAQLLHLGAGRGGREDSLYKFKSRFSSLRHDFVVGRWVLDAEAYQALVGSSSVQAKLSAGFFPAYRAPRTSSETKE